MSLCLSLADYANTQLSQVTQHAQNVRLRVWWIMQTPKQPSMQKNCQPQSLVDYANTQVIQHAQKVSDSQFGGLCKQPSNPA